METRIRKCLESECGDCTETSSKTTSCSYNIRNADGTYRGPMAGERETDCHYKREYVGKVIKNTPLEIQSRIQAGELEVDFSGSLRETHTKGRIPNPYKKV